MGDVDPRRNPRTAPQRRTLPPQAAAAVLADARRLGVFGALFCLVFFSFVSGKRVHYLMPEFALFALLAARVLAGNPAGRWGLVAPALTLMLVGAGVAAAASWLDTRLGGAVDAPGSRVAVCWRCWPARFS